jgi:pimeloyl-ACP methyl ester carboxylesterase
VTRRYTARGEDLALDDAARAAARGSFVSLSDGITQYDLAGPEAGPLVVLAPGITVPLSYWDATTAELHRLGLGTLTYSAYGRGWSDRVEGRYDQALFRRQLADLLNAVSGQRPLHLVGASMGALVAMDFATQPDATAPLSLTLIGPAGLTDQGRLLARLLAVGPVARLLGTFFGRRALSDHLSHNVRSSEDLARLTQLVGEPYRFQGSIYALLSTLRDFPLSEQQDLYRQASRLPLPKMLLWGEHDQVTPIKRLDAVRELFRPDECHVPAERGHMIPFEDPQGTARLLANFFAKTGPGGSA